MKNARSISICIPTCNRAELLLESINSCLNQLTLPAEILIGDDSSNDQTRDLVENLKESSPILIRYFHNRPSLRQALNVNMLISEAKSDYTVLLHDDDLLLDDALENMIACFDENAEVVVVYSKQYVISNKE